jgi:hypothetical protein
MSRTVLPAVLRYQRARGYAAKFRAETVSYEPPRFVEPTDANLASCFAWCVRRPRPAEYPAIRACLANWRVPS